jgi:hypothetical protein
MRYADTGEYRQHPERFSDAVALLHSRSPYVARADYSARAEKGKGFIAPRTHTGL